MDIRGTAARQRGVEGIFPLRRWSLVQIVAYLLAIRCQVAFYHAPPLRENDVQAQALKGYSGVFDFVLRSGLLKLFLTRHHTSLLLREVESAALTELKRDPVRKVFRPFRGRERGVHRP